jgi:hypothetical protein
VILHRLALPVIASLGLFCLIQPSRADLPQAPVILDTNAGGCVPAAEICGDGIDQDCNGTDTLCPGPDKDRDGYVEGADCDDTNRMIYPGISVPCTDSCGQGTKTCQSNGAFTSCSCTPLCEAAGSGRCYYVSRTTGSDTAAGTFAQPLKTQLRFHAAGSSHISLNAGDVVYFMSGLYDDSLVYESSRTGLYIQNINGTASAPIVFKAYPGAHPVFAPAVSAVGLHFYNSSYFKIEGLEIARAYQDGLRVSTSSNVEVRNIWVHDTDGVDNNNLAGVYLDDADYVAVHHSLIHDNYDRTCADTGGSKTENSRDLVLFQGGNNRIHHNVVFQTPAVTAQKTGSCIVYKHGMLGSGKTFEVDNNILWNCYFAAIGSSTYGGRFHHNLILNSDIGISLKNHGGVVNLSDNIAEYNTFVGTPGLGYFPREAIEVGGPIGQVTFRKNINVHSGSYNADIGGIIIIDPYGANTVYNMVVPTHTLTFDQNCYYNPNTEVKFGLFSYNDSSSNSLGGLYSLSGWQGFGYDQNSAVVNPALDANYSAHASQCQSWGHYNGQ